jgi:hypothetical protein
MLPSMSRIFCMLPLVVKDSKSLDCAAPFWVMDPRVELQSWCDSGFGRRRHFGIGLGWVGLR